MVDFTAYFIVAAEEESDRVIDIGDHMISSAIWNKKARANFSKTPSCTRPTGSCNFVSL